MIRRPVIQDTQFSISGGEVGHQQITGAVMGPDDPKPEHVKQGIFGDCFLLSGLMGLARRQPDSITHGVFQTDPQTPQATHKLRFYAVPNTADADQTLRPETVSVSNTVLAASRDVQKVDGTTLAKGAAYGAQGDELWPAVIEKGFAAWSGKPSTESLKGGHGDTALAMLTGEAHTDKTLGLSTEMNAEAQKSLQGRELGGATKREREAAVAAALTEERDRLVEAAKPERRQEIIDMSTRGGAATISTNQHPSDAWKKRCGAGGGVGASGEEKMGGIAHKHVYELVEATEDSVKMRNPWGKYSRVDGAIDENAAVSVLSWDEFFEVASSYSSKG